MPVARLDGVPLAGIVLEPTPPLRWVRAVLGVAGTVLGLDHPETPLGQKAESLCVMLHDDTLGHGSDGGLWAEGLTNHSWS